MKPDIKQMKNSLNPIDASFKSFHRRNPDVYKEIKRRALAQMKQGVKRIGVKMIFEMMRYDTKVQASLTEFKLNNNYHSRYARMLVRDCPKLKSVIQLRQLTAR